MASNLDRRNKRIIEMRTKGMLLQDIAAELGCSVAVVRHVVDLHYRTAAQRREQIKINIHALRNKGFTIREICMELDLGEHYVRQVLRHYRPPA